MTQPTTNDLTIKRVPRVMEETVCIGVFDDTYIGSLLYCWQTNHITAAPDVGRPRVFKYANMDQAKQYLIDQHLKNKEN